MVRDYRGNERGNDVEIVEGDKRDIMSCAAVLVNANKPSWGTAMEVHFAYSKGIPVVAFCDSSSPSPWLVYHTVSISKTLTDGLAAVRKLLNR